MFIIDYSFNYAIMIHEVTHQIHFVSLLLL
jgi:hypothetical protein